MYYDEDMIKAIVNGVTECRGVKLKDVEENGFLLFHDYYTLDGIVKVNIKIYEFKNKVYTLKYVDKKCVLFLEIYG